MTSTQLTCDNDMADSWEDGWTRQPPIYQESLYLSRQHADHRQNSPTVTQAASATGSLPSRNAGQNHIPIKVTAIPAGRPTAYKR